MIWSAALIALLASVAWTDWRRGVIPDLFNGVIASAGILKWAASGWQAVAEAAIAGAFALILAFALRWLYLRLRGNQGLGLGDVKFIGAAAVWIGLTSLPVLVLVASLSALIFVIGLGVLGHQIMATTRIAFGPHLAAGFATVWFLGPFV